MKKKRTKKLILIITISVILLVVAVLLFVFKPWTHSTNIEDTLITNIKALQNVDGRLYSYGEEIPEAKVLEEFSDTPYERLQKITDAPIASSHTYNCIVIVDIDGTVSLQDSDYEYIHSLVYEKDWWLMYMGTNEAQIATFIQYDLCQDDIENVGFMYKNSTKGNYSNTWNSDDTKVYNSTNKRLVVEKMLSDLLYAIRNL